MSLLCNLNDETEEEIDRLFLNNFTSITYNTVKCYS